jgi:hypothetical protein
MNEAKLTQEEKFSQEIVHHIKAGYQVFNITTSEEERVLRILCDLLDGPHKNDIKAHTVLVWDCVKGLQVALSKLQMAELRSSVFPGMLKDDAPLRDPIKVLDMITSSVCDNSEDFIVVFRDLDTLWNSNPMLWRMLRNVVNSCSLINSERRRPVFLVGNSGNVPENIKSEITHIDFMLPDEQMMQQIVNAAASMATTRDPNDSSKVIAANIERNPELEAIAVRNLLGLNCVEAENAVALALSKNKGINHGFVTSIREQKAQIFRKSEVLTYIPEGRIVKKNEIAGYDRVFDFVDRRRAAYTKTAEQAKIDKPKGLILLGPPGTGKSVVSELITGLLEMPGYQMDIGALLGSLVGESEKRTRTVLKQLQAEKGCVVILDEADKAFSGMNAGSSGDSGTSQRVFGQILSFLTRQDGNTFVVMTMNHVDHLPAELLRKGRFDAIFYTDFPDAQERRHVFEIHFGKRGITTDMLNFTQAEWKTILDSTENWTHAEIEGVVVESRYVAFQRDHAGIPTFEDLMQTVRETVSMYRQDTKKFDAMREICKSKGQPVTTPVSAAAKLPVKRSRQAVV